MRRPCGQGQPTPCFKDGKHCEKRHLGCQPTCPDYMAFYRRNVEVVYPRRQQHAILNNYIEEGKIKNRRKAGTI